MLYATVWTWGDICVAWDGVSRVYDVWVMSTRHGCQAIARRQVCMTRRDYRHVHGALGEVEWRRWVVRSCAGGLREVIGRWRYIAARGKYRYTSGAFLGVLMRWWSYVSVREVICDLSEVLVCLPFTEGAGSSRCSMAFGGSESRSQQRWSIEAYTARYKVILSRSQLLEYAWWFEIQLPERIRAGIMFGVGSEIC